MTYQGLKWHCKSKCNQHMSSFGTVKNPMQEVPIMDRGCITAVKNEHYKSHFLN